QAHLRATTTAQWAQVECYDGTESPYGREIDSMAMEARNIEQSTDGAPSELAGMRIAILAETLYEDLELWYPYYRLREAGADVFVVGSGSAETYQSKHGYPVTVDAEADTVTASQFDAVIIPGGYSPDHMRRHPGMVKLVREAH